MLVTLGLIVAVVLAGVWGVSALLGTALKDPAQSAAVIASDVVPSVSESTTSTAAAAVSEVEASRVASPTAPPPASLPAKTTAPAAPPKPKPLSSAGFVVVIDPGHQGHGDNTLEPIGPGSKTRKPAVASGAAGVVTHVHESVINLQVSLRIRDILEARGIKVIMVRTSENVNISNSERAEIANAAHADLLLRIHCDSATDQSVRGFLTLVPARNTWTGPIIAPSARAGREIHAATLSTTHAKNRGITPRSDMSGFNWSKVPSVIVEMAMMSNPTDDRLLSSDVYQQKLAEGIANGVVTFSKGR